MENLCLFLVDDIRVNKSLISFSTVHPCLLDSVKTPCHRYASIFLTHNLDSGWWIRPFLHWDPWKLWFVLSRMHPPTVKIYELLVRSSSSSKTSKKRVHPPTVNISELLVCSSSSSKTSKKRVRPPYLPWKFFIFLRYGMGDSPNIMAM